MLLMDNILSISIQIYNEVAINVNHVLDTKLILYRGVDDCDDLYDVKLDNIVDLLLLESYTSIFCISPMDLANVKGL